MMNVRSGERTTLITHSQYNLYQSNFSPDDRWVAFLAYVQSQRAQLFIAPVRLNSAPAEQGIPSDWIPATSGEFRDDKPRWSPDGKILYFLSDRDGFRCFWAQRLDPATKWPAGPPFAIYHFHGANRSMLDVSLAVLEPAVARDQIMSNLAETTANIWMTELEARR
jgi:Tol biopolymer transport system component